MMYALILQLETFASSSFFTAQVLWGAGVIFAAGDVISVVTPGTQDATLANIAFTFAGTA